MLGTVNSTKCDKLSVSKVIAILHLYLQYVVKLCTKESCMKTKKSVVVVVVVVLIKQS